MSPTAAQLRWRTQEEGVTSAMGWVGVASASKTSAEDEVLPNSPLMDAQSNVSGGEAAGNAPPQYQNTVVHIEDYGRSAPAEKLDHCC